MCNSETESESVTYSLCRHSLVPDGALSDRWLFAVRLSKRTDVADNFKLLTACLVAIVEKSQGPEELRPVHSNWHVWSVQYCME